MIHVWNGLSGEYRVPEAVLWLASKANLAAGLPADYFSMPPSVALRSPYYRVVQEWGELQDKQAA